MKPPKAVALLLARILLATSILLGTCSIAYGVYQLRLIEGVRFDSDEQLIGRLHSRGMSQATFKAALDLGERYAEERKLMVGLGLAHSRFSLVSGAGFLMLAISTWVVMRKVE